MRIVVYGAGAVGGVVGGLLYRAGQEVVLIARGEHLDALRRHGLRLEMPERTETLAVPVVDDPWQAGLNRPSIVLLGVKSQDTESVLRRLAAVTPPETVVVCMQNGVENERRALRRFGRVYSLVVVSSMSHLSPGVVQVHSAPLAGLLDLGRYPSGVDDIVTELAAALCEATFRCEIQPDVMRWKYAKLIWNLSNAVTALCGAGLSTSPLVQAARQEGEMVLTAAGIDFASQEEDARRHGRVPRLATESGPWRGGSSWQSVVRRTGSIEADFLSGEIVLLGRQVGVATPVNELLQREANRLVESGGAPGSEDADDLLARALADAGVSPPVITLAVRRKIPMRSVLGRRADVPT